MRRNRRTRSLPSSRSGRAARAARRAWCRKARTETLPARRWWWWIHAVLTWFLIPSGALGCDSSGALQQHAGNFGAVDNGAALVVDRTAGGAARASCGIERRIVEFAADHRFRRRLDQQHGRRHRAKPDPGCGAHAILQRETDADA